MFPDYRKLLDDPIYAAFFRAWEAARNGDALPARQDIRLQEFARYAESLLIYERKAPRDLRCRLLGSKLSEKIGEVGRETNWLDMVPAGTMDTAVAWWTDLFETPCGSILQISVTYPNGNCNLAHALFLPMTNAAGSIMILGLVRNLGIYRYDSEATGLRYGADCFEAQHVDVGFGLPASGRRDFAAKPFRPALAGTTEQDAYRDSNVVAFPGAAIRTAAYGV